MDANFPTNLAIKPSLPSGNIQHELDTHFLRNIAQDRSIEQYGIAGRVWEAAYATNLYVNPPREWLFDPPFLPARTSASQFTILELGSGVGLVAFHLSRVLEQGKDMAILTDLPDVCPLLQANLKTLDETLISVRPLAWGTAEYGESIFQELQSKGRVLTHVLCSDLVYFPELLAPLLWTLIQLTSPPFFSIQVTISCKIRSLSKETPFWSAFGLWFEYEPVVYRRPGTSSSWMRFPSSSDVDGTTFVFAAHRRPDSFTWDVPPNDSDLLAGVGARGTVHRKFDDTFESLLLLGLDNDDDGAS